MSARDRYILTITDPSIELDPLEVEDSESPDADKSSPSQASGDSESDRGRLGYDFPLIQLNTNQLKEDEIDFFKLSSSGFLPSLKLVINDKRLRFTNLDFPKDGDVVCVYLRPNDIETQREIRIDFDIVSIKVSSSIVNSFTIDGIMKIPGMYAEASEFFDNGTSFSHLNLVADNLNLGFASNEDSTNDSQVRIRPFDTNQKFIKDTTQSSYKDEDSFFTSFINLYYYLSFVNVNKQFSEEDDVESLSVSSDTNGSRYTDVIGSEGVELPFILSNKSEDKGSNLYIEKFGLENNTGSIWIKNGYKRYCQYFDIPTDSYESFFVDPLTTDGAESTKILLKGRNGEDFYKTQQKYKYVGKQYSGDNGNVHENYQFAKIQNIQNMKEIHKMSLNIELTRANFHLYRFQEVPVLIYTGDEFIKPYLKARDEILGEEETSQGAPDYLDGNVEVKNEFLSGYYVISEIHYVYKSRDEGIKQQIKLLRREWPIPAENHDY